jgi:hypothetical protein
MENYRIIVETELSGKQWFYVQKKCLFVFWQYFYVVRGCKIGYQNLEQAIIYMNSLIAEKEQEKQRSVVKTEVIKLETIELPSENMDYIIGIDCYLEKEE